MHLGLTDEKVSKGVRKLREKDAKEGKEIVLVKAVKDEEEEVMHDPSARDGARGESYAMDDIQSVSHRSCADKHPSVRPCAEAWYPCRSTLIMSTLTIRLSRG